MPNDIDRIVTSLGLLSLVELRRLRALAKDWRLKVAVTRRLWEKQHKRTVVGSTKATQLGLFGEESVTGPAPMQPGFGDRTAPQ